MMRLFNYPPQLLTAVAAFLVGLFCCVESQARDYDDWNGSSLSEIAASSANDAWTETNTVFIYNVGKKMFINRGGSWGTEAVLSNVGMEFKVVKSGNSYNFMTNMKAQNTTPYLGAGEGNDAGNYFVDQSALAFTVESATVDDKTCYKMKASNNYMCGSYSSNSSTASDLADEAINAFSSTDDLTDNSDKWIFVTVKERKDCFAQADITTKVEVPATFMMKDNDFARRSDEDVKSWKKADGSVLSNSYTTSTPPASSNTTTYYVGNGGADDTDTQSGTKGEKWTANIHGANGEIYQELDGLFRHGWYEIRCNAFTTSTTGKAILYASVADATAKTKAETNYAAATIQTLTSRPETYINANDVVNGSTTVNGEKIYTYQVVARVYVGTSGAEADEYSESSSTESCEKLKFGVKTSDGSASDWLCVDNFSINYIGVGTNKVVLDETKDDVEYMNNQSTGTNSTIYLNRSLTANAWNSIVLPFDMNSSDIIDAFGSGTVVSKYVGAKEGGEASTIYFDAATTIEKGKLYIIKPTTGEPDNNNIEVQSTKDETLKLTGKYYTIPNIVYGSTSSDDKFTASVTDNSADLYTGAAKYTFAGTYVKTQGTIPAYSYMLKASSDEDHTGSSSKWYYRTKKSSSLGFRGWLQPTKEENAGAKLSFVINGIEDSTTAIDGITADDVKAQDGRIYNLAGQLVSGKLAKGLYIQNGKKFIVK